MATTERLLQSELWTLLRRVELQLPLWLQRPLAQKFATRFNPYTAENDRTKSIFIHIPKCAGTSIGHSLYGYSRAHLPITRYAAHDPRRFRSYFKFAFVRNPWDRLLSGFSYLRPGARGETDWSEKYLNEFEDFEAFVLSLRDARTRSRVLNFIHFRPQLTWITLPGSKHVALDYIARFESLGDDFQLIANRLGIDAMLPESNASDRGPYRLAYTPEMREIVGDIYRDDIEVFGYDF